MVSEIGFAKEDSVEFLIHLFAELLAALGRILLSISAVLVLEELTWGGLARLLLSSSRRTGRRAGNK
jgi:hypothetical protein